MDKKFIAYFDLLGFKQFLQNNTEDVLAYRCKEILKNIEIALSLDEFKQRGSIELIADRKNTNINCLNVSDTVIFYSKDDTLESFKEFIAIIYQFNKRINFYNFPVRGYATHDFFNMIYGQDINELNTVYSANLMYGKGLYNAHERAEMLEWAGCAIDGSIERRLHEIKLNDLSELKKYAKEYDVPYKGYTIMQYALKLASDSEQEEFKKIKEGLIMAFKNDYKSITPSVQIKLDNTIKYLETFFEVEKE